MKKLIIALLVIAGAVAAFAQPEEITIEPITITVSRVDFTEPLMVLGERK